MQPTINPDLQKIADTKRNVLVNFHIVFIIVADDHEEGGEEFGLGR